MPGDLYHKYWCLMEKGEKNNSPNFRALIMSGILNLTRTVVQIYRLCCRSFHSLRAYSLRLCSEL